MSGLFQALFHAPRPPPLPSMLNFSTFYGMFGGGRPVFFPPPFPESKEIKGTSKPQRDTSPASTEQFVFAFPAANRAFQQKEGTGLAGAGEAQLHPENGSL